MLTKLARARAYMVAFDCDLHETRVATIEDKVRVPPMSVETYFKY
jgi:hypothetical protein